MPPTDTKPTMRVIIERLQAGIDDQAARDQLVRDIQTIIDDEKRPLCREIARLRLEKEYLQKARQQDWVDHETEVANLRRTNARLNDDKARLGDELATARSALQLAREAIAGRWTLAQFDIAVTCEKEEYDSSIDAAFAAVDHDLLPLAKLAQKHGVSDETIRLLITQPETKDKITSERLPSGKWLASEADVARYLPKRKAG